MSASNSAENPGAQLLRSHSVAIPVESHSVAVESHSVAKPVEPSLLAEGRKLDHYPRRYKRSTEDGQKAENSLAKRLCKAWECLSEGEREILKEMQGHSAAKPV